MDDYFDDYTDSDRLDELATAEDYNRFEEAQLALDRDFEYDGDRYEFAVESEDE